MDFEKAYKGLVAKVKNAHLFAQTDSTKNVLEDILPELRESEDERIRKAIVHLFEEASEAYLVEATGFKKEQFLSYLEKQKEKKFDFALIKRAWYMEGYKDREFGKESKWIIKTGNDGPKYEENPKYGQMLAGQKPAECIEDSVKFEEGFKTGRESGLRDGQKYVLDNAESYGLSKPAEWGEEDETCLTNILIMLKEYVIHHYSKDDVNKSVDWLENRFKSLRPQPHWNPSEEQMEALLNILHPDDPYYYELKSLYEQLQKL